MTAAPLEIRIAFDHGHARYKHEPIDFPVPPGTLLYSFAPTSKDEVWQYFLWRFGSVSPAGPTTDLYFEHWQEGVERHRDIMHHSLLDTDYPIWANSTAQNPHYIEMHNLTGAVQTIDMELHHAMFPSRADYIRWYQDLILLGLRSSISPFLLKVMGVSLKAFNEGLQQRCDEAYDSHLVRRLKQILARG